jgi:hypothetical protein
VKVRDLMHHWEKHAGAEITARKFSVQLPLYDAARLLALAEMYPAKTETQIITELLGAALDELQEALPYAQGKRVIAADDHGDPIYEDVGPTPDFFRKTQEYARRLEAEAKNTPRD